MAAALPENKSLQERINALHIQLKAANEERDNRKVELNTEDAGISKPRPGNILKYHRTETILNAISPKTGIQSIQR